MKHRLHLIKSVLARHDVYIVTAYPFHFLIFRFLSTWFHRLLLGCCSTRDGIWRLTVLLVVPEYF